MTHKYDELHCPYTGQDGPCCGCEKEGVALGYGGSHWGDECNDDLTYYLDMSRAPTTSQLPDDAAYASAFREAFNIIEATCGVKFRRVNSRSQALVYIRFQGTSRGVLAWSNVGGRCGQQGEQAYGTQWNWQRQRLITVILHEVGHLLGLNHDDCTNRDGSFNVMCWQIGEDVTEYDYVTAGLLVQGYGKPNGPNPDPDPDPDPPNRCRLFRAVAAWWNR